MENNYESSLSMSDSQKQAGASSSSAGGEEDVAGSSAAASSSSKDGGHSLPMARVKTIINTVPDILPVNQEALFAFTKSAELFIEDLIRNVHEKHGNNIDYDQIADYILENEELSFLHEFFPRRISLAEALRRVREKDNQ